jgi:hypothetical protein
VVVGGKPSEDARSARLAPRERGRLLTLEDTVEFFNLVLGVQLTPREKAALVAFMCQL